MELHFRKSGQGSPLIILHGLYGSADNWHSIGRELSAEHTVYLVDQRNHGSSPHSPVHSYDAMRADLLEFIDRHELPKAIIMGHSMGGKTALHFGLKHTERIEKLVVVDISPFDYEGEEMTSEGKRHLQIISALQLMDTTLITNREDADRQLARFIASPAIRQFLLKNLKRSSDGSFHWALNIQALAHHINDIFSGIIRYNPQGEPLTLDFPLLFIKGERSDYIGAADERAIRQYFPSAGLVTIGHAGHWVHAEQPAAFLEVVNTFIRQ